MDPLHEAHDGEKLAALVASMEERGWQGEPLVIDGTQLITGSHRYAAAKELGWPDSEIPTIELADVFSEAGLNLYEVHAEFGHPTINEPDFVAMLEELPESVRDKYGIDLR